MKLIAKLTKNERIKGPHTKMEKIVKIKGLINSIWALIEKHKLKLIVNWAKKNKRMKEPNAKIKRYWN
jgi:hypothetical protein